MTRAPLRGVEYRIRYQRRGWLGMQQRILNNRRAVDLLLWKLRAGNRPDLQPVIVLLIDERPVGKWKRSTTVTIPKKRPT